jgi:hypothetical protein
MKKTFILLVTTILLAFSTKGQINLENHYVGTVRIANLSTAGYKFYNIDIASNVVKIYNIDHSIYQTITLPNPPVNQTYSGVYLLSDKLFDTDNLIEFVLLYKDSQLSNFTNYHKVINENGVILLQNNKIEFEALNLSGTYKLRCMAPTYDSSFVYSLPGTLPCDACGGPTSIVKNNSSTNTMPNAYPNPTSTQITIPYKLTNSDTKGKINFYDINGKILREYNVDNTFENLILDTKEFSAGTYYYNLTSNSGKSDAKKIIVIK